MFPAKAPANSEHHPLDMWVKKPLDDFRPSSNWPLFPKRSQLRSQTSWNRISCVHNLIICFPNSGPTVFLNIIKCLLFYTMFGVINYAAIAPKISSVYSLSTKAQKHKIVGNMFQLHVDLFLNFSGLVFNSSTKKSLYSFTGDFWSIH